MSKIEWTNKTWNPIIGCSKISEGCQNCYAEKIAFRLLHMPFTDYYSYVMKDNGDQSPDCFQYIPEWNGKTHLVKSALEKPLKRKKPTMYFVCSMGDLFHESVPFKWIDKVIHMMTQCPQHTFQILTKRPDIMQEYFTDENIQSAPDNVWLGITAENQEQADKRIPFLLNTPATVRFVSIEPMLGPVDLLKQYPVGKGSVAYGALLDWVICGGESGRNARQMNPDWVRFISDQCKEVEIPFFFKQWGDFYKAGKKKAGSMLDGKEYKQFPI